MGASRIGHGIHVYENKSMMMKLLKSDIPLEICPTSNLDTKAAKTLDELHIKEFLKEGLCVTINTDDPTVSNTTLKEEYKLLEKMGLSLKDAKKIAQNTVKAAFLDEKEKEKLLEFLK